MVTIFLLKTICQLSIYFVFLRFIMGMLHLQLAHFGTMALYVFVLFISFCLRERTPMMRMMPLLLVGVLIPFASAGDWFFVLIPVTGFAVYISFNRKYSLNEDAFRSVTGIAMWLFIVLGVISAFSDGQGAEFLLVALIAGLFLSRDLRHDVSTIDEPTYKRLSLWVLLVVAIIAFLGGSGLIQRAIFAVGRGLRWLWISLFDRLFDEPPLDLGEWFDFHYNGEGDGFEDEFLGYAPNGHTNYPGWIAAISVFQVVLVLSFVAAIILMGIWISRKLFAAYGEQSDGDEITRELVDESVNTTRRVSERLTGYSGAVRRHYRRFLKLVNKKGGNLAPGNTSKDLEGIAYKTLGDDAGDLRHVYIRARYSSETITKQDTHLARDAVKRLKNL